MFEQILQLVKEQIGGNPQIAAGIPDQHTEAVHNEIANHINDTLQNQTPSTPSSGGGILSQIEQSIAGGNMTTSAITGGLIGTLGSKFGLPAAVTGAIAAAIPGMLQKLVNKPNPQTA